MKANRFSYFIIVVITIIAGLLSRKIAFIPFFVGDFLYAVMIYFGIRFVFISLNRKSAAIIGLSLCYAIELLQLYDAQWLLAFRNTFLGRSILGQGFLWSDLIAYSFGVIVAYYLETILTATDRNTI